MEQSSGIYITEMSAFPHPYCDPSTRNGSFFENEVLKVVHSLMYRLWLRIILSLSKVSSPRKPSLIVQGNNDLNFPCIIFLPKTVKNNVVEILASLYPLKETKKNWGVRVNKGYLLSTSFVPSKVFGFQDIMLNKTDMVFLFSQTCSPAGKKINN